jgi:hypothetical protein
VLSQRGGGRPATRITKITAKARNLPIVQIDSNEDSGLSPAAHLEHGQTSTSERLVLEDTYQV